jgi:pilus assembly protein TadC
MELLIAGITFLAVALATWEIMRPRGNAVARRLARGQESLPDRTAPASGKRDSILASIGRVVARVVPGALVNRIARMLVMADEGRSVFSFLGLWTMSVALGVAIVLLMNTLRPTPLQLLMTLIGCALGFGAGPYVVLRGRVRRRQQAVGLGLPYVLDLLVTCVEAGLSMDAAIATVAEKTRGPLGSILARYLREVGLGRPRRDALLDVAQQTGVNDLIALASAIVQAEQLGVTVGDALRAQARELRITRRQRVQTAAQRAPVLMSIPLSICFMPAMMAVTLVPSLMHLAAFVGNLESSAR